MKVKMGPHQRRGRFRRRMKAVAITAAILMAALTGGPAVREDVPEPEPTLSPTAYQYMMNVSALSPGNAVIWAERYPEAAEDFLTAAGLR